MASVGSKRLFACNEGRISGNMPGYRSVIDAATGWDYSIFGFTAVLPGDFNPRFSQYLSPGKQGAKIAARWRKWRGRTYLEVTRTGPPLGKDVFLLDPRKAFSIVRCDHFGWQPTRGPGGHLRFAPATWAEWRFWVNGFYEPVRGVFYPRSITYKHFFRQQENQSVKVAVVKVAVNVPHINAHTWVVKFPRNSLVRDASTGKIVRITGTPAQQLKEIEAAVKVAK